jgi:hypothetical protein
LWESKNWVWYLIFTFNRWIVSAYRGASHKAWKRVSLSSKWLHVAIIGTKILRLWIEEILFCFVKISRLLDL